MDSAWSLLDEGLHQRCSLVLGSDCLPVRVPTPACSLLPLRRWDLAFDREGDTIGAYLHLVFTIVYGGNGGAHYSHGTPSDAASQRTFLA